VSRIHEALKRAEEDRAAAQAVHLESVVPFAVSATAPSVSPLPAPGSEFSYTTLLSRCAPSSWSPDTKTMLFYNSEQAPGTEEFRTLRSRLYQLREKRPLKKVLVTSSLPKEGKSFVAANLAQALARQQGRRVLLIDADLRASRLHLALGTSATPGLSEYLLGEADEFGIMQRGTTENLLFIPAGRSTSNPAEMIANGRLSILLGQAEPLFDWIVIDSPPVIPVADALVLAGQADASLLVVRAGQTPSDAVEAAIESLGAKHVMGVILNGVEGLERLYSKYNKYYGSAAAPTTT